jgi:hypothetical protein
METASAVESPKYLNESDGLIVDGLSSQSELEHIDYPFKEGPYAQMIKSGTVAIMKLPKGYSKVDVNKGEWKNR